MAGDRLQRDDHASQQQSTVAGLLLLGMQRLAVAGHAQPDLPYHSLTMACLSSPRPPPLPCPACLAVNTLAGQVLGSADVLGLVQVMLFLQARKLHDSQQGRAAAAAPRTSRSGRPKKNPKPADQPDSRQPVQVCHRHVGSGS